MKTTFCIILILFSNTFGHATTRHVPIQGTYTIEKLLPLCISDYPGQLKTDTLVGQSIEFNEGKIIFKGISHDIDSLRYCAFRNGEYHDGNCDSVKHVIHFKDLDYSGHRELMVEYLLSFHDDYQGFGNHLIYFDFESIVVGFDKKYYKLKAIDLPSDFNDNFVLHSEWKKVNDSLYVLLDFDKEFNDLSSSFSQGHQPWRMGSKNAAAACLVEFGIRYKFGDIERFASRLTEIKKDESYSVEVGRKTYLIQMRLKKGIPVPYRLEVKNSGSAAGD
jgi:hypothetical protein